MLHVSLLFPGRNLNPFRRLLDPHFPPTEVYEVYVASINLETTLNSIRQGLGRVRLLIQPLIIFIIVAFHLCMYSCCFALVFAFDLFTDELNSVNQEIIYVSSGYPAFPLWLFQVAGTISSRIYLYLNTYLLYFCKSK